MTTKPEPKIITATDASNHFGRMIEEASHGQSLFLVTRMGQPRVVVLGVERYRELMEELETVREFHDTGHMAAIDEAREEILLGQTLTLEELDKELGFTEEELASIES